MHPRKMGFSIFIWSLIASTVLTVSIYDPYGIGKNNSLYGALLVDFAYGLVVIAAYQISKLEFTRWFRTFFALELAVMGIIANSTDTYGNRALEIGFWYMYVGGLIVFVLTSAVLHYTCEPTPEPSTMEISEASPAP